MSYLLGSFIPNPVSADIVSFLTDEEICQFNMISPRARAIVNTYKLIKNDFHTIRFGWIEKPTEIRILKDIGEEDFFLRILEPNDEIERKQMIKVLLTKCRSIKVIDMCNQSIDKCFMELLMKPSPKYFMIFDTKIDVSPQLLLAFVKKFPRAVSFCRIEISNKVLDEEIFLLLKNAGFFRSWKSDCQHFESRVVNVTDATLEEIMRRSKAAIPKFLTQIHLCGFINGFTVEGINSYALENYAMIDFGILGCDQIAEAVALSRREEIDNNWLRLQSWNGQKTLVFEFFYSESRAGFFKPIFWPQLKFAVSLTETIDGPVSEDSLPVPGIPTEGLLIFDKLVKVWNTVEDFNLEETEKYDFARVLFRLKIDKTLGNKLTIRVNDDKFGRGFVVLVRTDISLSDVYCLVAKFSKMCHFIENLECEGISLNQEFYKLLKPIADDLTIKNPWTSSTQLNNGSVLYILKATNGLFAEFYFTESYEEVSANESLVVYLTKKLINFDWAYLLKSDGAGGYVTPLTDDLLQQMSTKVEDLPSFLILKMYTSKFTAEGIKLLLEALRARSSPFRYHLGMIDQSNKEHVQKMVGELYYDLWHVDREATETVRSWTIGSKRPTVARDGNWNDHYDVSFDIVTQV